VSSAEEILVVSIGWTALDGDSGICSRCSRTRIRLPRPSGRLERTPISSERAERAVAISRLVGWRSRSSISAVAGFSARPRPSDDTKKRR
jgi:hypothetical protein